MKGFEYTLYLSDLNLEEYLSLGVAQKWEFISRRNFTYQIRKIVNSDPLVQKVSESPFLFDWMLCCSDMDEQYWLNTCETAARNDMMSTHFGTLAQCLVITKEICTHIEDTALEKLDKQKPWVIFIFKKLPTVSELF